MLKRPVLEDLDLVGPDHYAENGYPHQAWALLRKHAPVFWYTKLEKQCDPFWAITRHEDIVWISKQPRRFLNQPRLAVFPEIPEEEGDAEAHHLLTMDPPEHQAMRGLLSRRFSPRALAPLRAEIDQITGEILDELTGEGDLRECDFVEEVAAFLPLAVIARMLGVPQEDWPLLFEWTNSTIGAADPEYQQPGETALETANRARGALFQYFIAMADERRKNPKDDIVSALVAARLGGEPLPPRELLSYFFLLVVAGNETTRNATTGGLLALIENPGELSRLQRDPRHLSTAVEEIVRWTTPVIQFCRTAGEDVELHGETIRAGESVCLFYPSANRDERVFDDPDAFRVDRNPNPHVAFGIGEHVCMGANLARLELESMFGQLARRLESVELAGPVKRLRSSFVGGIKHMPVRYRMR